MKGDLVGIAWRGAAVLVRGAGIEPAHPFGYEILSLGRLPISPPAQASER